MTEEQNPWTTVSSEQKYDNPWITVTENKVLNPSGGEGIYGTVHFKNQAVGVIPIDNVGNTWLVGQYRYVLDKYSWEIPEGGSPEGEEPLETAKRELKEETGLTAKTWTELARMHLSNSVSDEHAVIYLAEDLTEGETNFEPTEKLAIRKVPFAEALQMVLSGEITDSMSVAGILKVAYQSMIKRKFDIAYQDDYCVIVNKPVDLLVHRTPMSKDREFLLQHVRNQIKQKVHPVHRLDRPTSGLVLFSTDRDTHNLFSELFAERNIRKTYIALVRGYVEESGVIDSPLKNPSNKTEMQDAYTEYERLATVELPHAVGRYETARYSLVKINLGTGRMHQIRRHFAHIRHPLVGDSTYGDGQHNRFFRDHFKSRRLMLMAVRLQFTHPITEEEIDAAVPLDADFASVLERMGMTYEL